MNYKNSKTLWKLTLFIFLLVGNEAVLFAQTDKNKKDEKPEIKFDGLYRTDKITLKNDSNNQYYKYLRFCEDNTVLGMSATHSAKQVARWLNCEKAETTKFSLGKYNIENDKIYFTLKSESGKVDYEGIVETNLIILNTFSHINNNKEKDIKFNFIRIASDQK